MKPMLLNLVRERFPNQAQTHNNENHHNPERKRHFETMRSDQSHKNRTRQPSKEIGNKEFSGRYRAQTSDETHQIIGENRQDESEEKEQTALGLRQMIPAGDHRLWCHPMNQGIAVAARQQKSQLAGDHGAGLSDQSSDQQSIDVPARHNKGMPRYDGQKYLQSYMDEFAFRYNRRDHGNMIFRAILQQVSQRAE